AKHKMVDLMRGRARFPKTVGGSDFQTWLNEQPETEKASRWDIEYRRSAFAWAATQVRRQVKARTWQAFEATVVRGEAVADVAREMGVAAGWIYVARGRVLARLRELVQGVEGEGIGLSSGWEDEHAL